jgi:hypothetical protein
VSDEVFQQLARDAFRRVYARLPDLPGDDRWLSAYVTALKDVTADRQTQTPGLLALLLDVVDEQRRVIEGMKGKPDS